MYSSQIKLTEMIEKGKQYLSTSRRVELILAPLIVSTLKITNPQPFQYIKL